MAPWRNEEFNQLVLAASLDCVVVADEDGSVLHINPAAERMLGWRQEEIRGRSLRDTIVPPALRGAHQAGWERWLRTNEPVVIGKRLELPALHRSGVEIPVELVVMPIRPKGTRQYLVAYLRDLRARKSRERELRLAQFALERCADAVFWIRPDATIMEVNEAACSSLGYSADELRARTVLDFDLNMTREAWDAHWRELRQRGSIPVRSRHRRRDGSTFPVEVSANYIEADGEEFNCAFARDVTEQEVAGAQLLNARDEAERASRAKSDFLVRMSHELRTPLGAILGYASMMEGEADTAARDEQVRALRRNAAYLLELIKDLLDLSRIEKGDLRLEREATEVTAIVADVVETLRPHAEARGLAFFHEVDEDARVHVITDRVRLGQVLLNVGENAVKYTHRGEVRLQVRRDVAAGTLNFLLSDTGAGIPQHLLHEIFDPFRRGSSQDEGLGLGLDISRQLAELLGGGIDLESQEGRGTRVRVWIPLDVAEPAAPASEPEHPVRSEDGELAGVRALVVDDNPDNLRYLRHYLVRAGAHCEVAGGGAEALDALRSHERFDVVLMDLLMPEMDGFTTTGTLRARGVELPIVAVTASAREEDRAAALAAGCDGFLSKPVERERLVGVVRRAGAIAAWRREAPLVRRSSRTDEDFRELVLEYLGALPQIVTAFERAWIEGDREALRREAHRLKGSAQGYGFEELGANAAGIQAAFHDEASLGEIGEQLGGLLRLLRGARPATG